MADDAATSADNNNNNNNNKVDVLQRMRDDALPWKKFEITCNPMGDDGQAVAPNVSLGKALWLIVCGKAIVSACLLLFMPVALWAVHYEWPATWIFWLNFLVMIPLTSILRDFTEELVLQTNQTV